MAKAYKLTPHHEIPFKLIALVTTEPLYKIAWHLNELGGFTFSESDPRTLYHPKLQLVQSFQYFVSPVANDGVLELLSNRSDQGFLLEEVKQADFLLKIQWEDVDMVGIITLLKRLKNISLAYEVAPGSVKQYQRLIF